MKILAIDTTSNTATAAVTDDNRLIAQYTTNYKKTHSQKIMPMIDSILTEADLTIQDIDLFAVSNGPGSFTGVRIGIATMKAFAHVLQKPIVAVNALEALAYNTCHTDDIICAMIDARHENIYYAIYQWREDALICLQEPCADTLEVCIEKLQAYQKNILFTGDGVFAYRHHIESMLERAVYFTEGSMVIPQAVSVAICAWRKAVMERTQSYVEVFPCYLRKSQAEREAEERGKKNVSNRQ